MRIVEWNEHLNCKTEVFEWDEEVRQQKKMQTEWRVLGLVDIVRPSNKPLIEHEHIAQVRGKEILGT